MSWSRTGLLTSEAIQIREEIYTAFNTIYPVLREYRKP